MIIRGATLIGRMAAIFVILFAYTACGGGGGSSDVGFFPDNDNDASAIALALFDQEGNSTRTVTSSAPGTLKVSVGGGANIVVTAETDIGTIFPLSGTQLTDASGVATFQVEAGLEKGAGTITASAVVNEEAISGELPFQVGGSDLQLGYFDDDGMFVENAIFIEPSSTLSAGGNAQFSVVVLDSNGKRVTTAEEVRFSSGCIAAGLATISPVNPKSVNGEASTLYTAAGCSGTDEITASLTGAGAQAFGTMSIAAPKTNAINFVSADPLLIVLRGTGGQNRDETSDVVFRVVDGTGMPLSGVTVNFSLSTYVGDLELSKTSALSDGDGQVSVTVQAGDVATVVRVLATVDDGDGNPVTTVSDLLTVTTGLPDQDSIGVAIGESVVVGGAFNTFGLIRTITVSMSDEFNNPVVDGTAAVFTTEYGTIESSCTTVGGACTVEWRSQEPRLPLLTDDDFVVSDYDNQGVRCPSHNGGNAIPCPEDLGYIRGGRSTITVTAIGQESFIDRNGNGIMDQAEKDLFDNIPEAFFDYNEDGVYTPALSTCEAAPMGSLQCIAGQEEEFVDFNSNQVYDLNDDPALYNGLLCPVEGDGIWCSRTLVNVRAENVVTLGDGPNFEIYLVGPGGNVTSTVIAGTSYTVFIADTYNNPPPAGSTVTLSADGDCKLVGASSNDVFNQDRSGAFVWPGSFTADYEASDEPQASSVKVSLSAPTVDITWSFGCVPAPTPPDPNDPG